MEIPIKTTKPTILINFILDESGSMLSQRDSVISGFNEYIQSHQNKADANYLVSLVKFSDADKIEVVFAGKQVSQVRKLTRDDYNPDGGTALFDAIARTIFTTESRMRELPEGVNVLTFIFTDGEENASSDFNKWQSNGTIRINQMITAKEDTGHWTFSFVGSSRDSLKQAQSIGIKLGNTFHYNHSNSGNTIAAMSAATTAYTRSVNASLDSHGDGSVYTNCLFKDAGITSDADVNKIVSGLNGAETITPTTSGK